MLDSRTIHADWVHFFNSVHTEDGWISPLLDSVRGVDVATAAWKPSPKIASIWEIVYHATGWIEDLLADLTGSNGLDHSDWPPVSDQGEEAWLATVERLEEKIAMLEREIKGLSVEDIYSPPPRVRKRRSERLINIFVHNAYHAGQIVKLRQLYADRRALAVHSIGALA